jgi:hypothetical protein
MYDGDPVSVDCLVEDNLVEDVPWHGLDTHDGVRIDWHHNTTRRCARAMFLTKRNNSPKDNIVRDNSFLEPKTWVGWPNAVALTLYSVNGVTITNNTSSSSYPKPMTYDYTGVSTGIVESGTAYVP